MAIHLSAIVGDHYSKSLAARAAQFNTAAAIWEDSCKTFENKLRTIAPPQIREHGREPVASYIQDGTFDNVEEVLAEVESLRRDRIAQPFHGLGLIAELGAIRDEAQTEWAAHLEQLRAKLAKAEDQARKDAEAFAGLSDAAKAQHVRDTVATQRQAVEQAQNPCPETYYAWTKETLKDYKAALLADLRQSFIAATR